MNHEQFRQSPDFTLTWCSFSLLPDAQAAVVSKFCFFSLATLETASCSESQHISLVEQEYPDAWRWAILSVDGFIIQGGAEPTQAQAKVAAEAALRSEVASDSAVARD